MCPLRSLLLQRPLRAATRRETSAIHRSCHTSLWQLPAESPTAQEHPWATFQPDSPLSYDCANQGWLSAVSDLRTSGYLQPRELSQAMIVCRLDNKAVTVKYSNINLTWKYNLIARRFLQSVENMKSKVQQDKQSKLLAYLLGTFSLSCIPLLKVLPICFTTWSHRQPKAHGKGEKQEAKDKKSLSQLHSQTKGTYVYISNGLNISLPKCSNFWEPSLIKEYFRCWWAVYYFYWGIRQTEKLLFILLLLYRTV